MAMERNSNGVLAKLMGIDRLSLPNTTHQRQRVLSENYFQNIASVVHRERSALDLDEDEFSMAVDALAEYQDTVEVSEGSDKDNASLNLNGLNSSLRNKLDEKSLSQNHRFEFSGGFKLQGFPHSFSGKKREFSDAQVLKKSHQCIETGCFRPNMSRKWVKEENDCCLSTKSVAKLNKPGRESSFSSLSPLSGGKEQNVTSCVKRKGINFQRKRMKSFYNDIESSRQGSVFLQEIAKQITSEVKYSVWHSCREPSTSGSRSDGSSVSEHERIMPLSSTLSELDNNHEPTSFVAGVTTSSIETQNMKKQMLEKWRTKKSSREIRTSREISNRVVSNVSDRNDLYLNTPFKSGSVNGLWVAAARYLSKPVLFPSAWVPRGISRQFMLDKNWCLRPGEICGLRSTSEPGVLTNVDSQKGFCPQEAPSTPKSSGILEEQNVGKELSSALESFSDRSSLQDVESPTYHEVPTILNENVDKLSEKHISLEGSVAPLSSDCSFALVNVDSEQVADEENEKTVTAVKFQWEHLSAELTKCSLMEKTRSNSQDSDKQQLKDNAAIEPWSPVSSLEGPEAWGQHSDEISSVAECFVNDLHGLHTKLQLIEAASLESGSEGPGMMVSSDEGDEGGSVGCYWEDAQIMEIPALSENQEISYLADVLAKSGFLLSNSELDAETYCFLGYVLNPSLFKSLEEKYSKQPFWERSDRKLLFDRINSGLMEIAQPLVGINIWSKPVAKRFISSSQGQKTIEEQLWAELVNQEEKFKKKSSDNLCMSEIEWLELEEDTSLLVQEMEFFLIDELIEEFVKEVFGEV